MDKDDVQEKIEQIIESFDFVKTHGILTMLKWADVLTIDQLVDVARSLLEIVTENGVRVTAQGLEAENKNGTLYLRFTVEEVGA